MHQIVRGRNPMEPFDLRRPGKTDDPSRTHEHSDQPFAYLNAHAEGELGVDAAGAVGLG